MIVVAATKAGTVRHLRMAGSSWSLCGYPVVERNPKSPRLRRDDCRICTWMIRNREVVAVPATVRLRAATREATGRVA